MTRVRCVCFRSWLYEENSQYSIGNVSEEVRRGGQVVETSKADSGEIKYELKMKRIIFGCFLNATRGFCRYVASSLCCMVMRLRYCGYLNTSVVCMADKRLL